MLSPSLGPLRVGDVVYWSHRILEDPGCVAVRTPMLYKVIHQYSHSEGKTCSKSP